MTDFDDEYAAGPALDLLSMYGETITFAPRSGSPRTLTAIVNRNPLQGLSSVQDMPSVKVLIRVLDDSANATYGGIAASAVDLGGDRIRLAVRSGGTAEYLALKEFVSDNGGMNTFAAN